MQSAGTPGTKEQGGIYNFVTKRRLTRIRVDGGETARPSWKYPGVVSGDNAVGEFSLA